MALREDLAIIEKSTHRALVLIQAAAISTVRVFPEGDMEGDTDLPLTAPQRQAIMARLGPLIAQIKTLAAGLPSM